MTFADFEKTQKQRVFMPGWYMINILIGIMYGRVCWRS